MDVKSIFTPTFQGLTESQKTFLIDRGAIDYTATVINAVADSNSTVIFQNNPPSPNSIVNRNMMVSFDVLATIKGVIVDDVALITPNTFSLRHNPISMITSTAEVQINGMTTISQQLAVTEPILSRYGSTATSRMGFSSIMPTALDTYAIYKDGDGTRNSPLNWYGEAAYGSMSPRGSYPMTITKVSDTEYTVATSVSQWFSVGPFFSNEREGHGGISNIQSMQLQMTLNNLPRMFSWDTSKITLTSFDVRLTKQKVVMYVSTPPPDFYIAPKLEFQFSGIRPFITSTSSIIQPTKSSELNSNNIQLNTIPKYLFICVRQADEITNGNVTNQVSTSDTALPIERLTITFDNKSGILSSASAKDLYYMSVDNGLNSTWAQFSGSAPNYTDADGYHNIPTVGSFICLQFGKDIPISYPAAVSSTGSWNLQIQVNTTNNRTTDFKPELVILTSVDTLLTIDLQNTYTTTGLVTSAMVSEAEMYHMGPDSLANMQGGARFGSMKNFFDKHGDMLANIGKSIGRVVTPRFTAALEAAQPVSTIRGLRQAYNEDRAPPPAPVTTVATSGASIRAGGRPGKAGGGLVGGRYVANEALKQRLR